jgi:hypothetical protein
MPSNPPAETVEDGDQVVGHLVYAVTIAGLVGAAVAPQIGGDAAMALGKVAELVDPLQGMAACPLDKEQHRLCLTGTGVDDT